MLKYYRHQFNFLCVFTDLVTLVLSFLGAYLVRLDLIPFLSERLARRPVFTLPHYFPVLVLAALVVAASLYVAGAYRQTPGAPFSQTFFRTLRGVLLALVLTLALAFLLKMTFMSRSFLLLFLVFFLVLATGARHALALYFRRGARLGRFCRHVVLVGANRQARDVARRLRENPSLGLRVKGYYAISGGDAGDDAEMTALGVPCLGTVSEMPAGLEKDVVDGVIFTGDAKSLGAMEDLFLICEDLGVETLVAANLFPHLIAKVELQRLEELPLLNYTTVPHNHAALFVKRVMDVGASACALLLLSPLMGLVALLVKVTSPGPVLFTQERMGLNGRRFRCRKFRTMIANAETLQVELAHMNEADGPVFKIRRDPRITPLGRILRKSSLDELPQLWNVLRGDMSLVGPRPPIPSEVERYERWQRRRLSMRPGLTCLWQISGRSDLDFDTWMKLDLKYIDDWSLSLDLVILLKTIPAVLSARGAA